MDGHERERRASALESFHTLRCQAGRQHSGAALLWQQYAQEGHDPIRNQQAMLTR